MAAVKKESVSKKEELKLTRKAVRSGLLDVSKLIFNKVVVVEREYVLMILMGMFRRLRYEDLEEVYNDGCLVLWEKMKDKELNLKEKSMVGYLISICRNIGMHYLRKVNDDVVSLDRIMERGCEVGDDDDDSVMEEMFDVVDERGSENEMFERLDKVWSRLKEVDRWILESYYVNGCRMEEIAKIIGFKNGNSVKSKKNVVLKKMREMMEEIRKNEEEWEKKRKEEEEKERKRKEEEEKEKKRKEEKKRIREEKKKRREEEKMRREEEKKRKEEEKEEKMRIKEEKMKKKEKVDEKVRMKEKVNEKMKKNEKVDEKVKMKENEKVNEIVEMKEMTLAIAV